MEYLPPSQLQAEACFCEAFFILCFLLFFLSLSVKRFSLGISGLAGGGVFSLFFLVRTSELASERVGRQRGVHVCIEFVDFFFALKGKYNTLTYRCLFYLGSLAPVSKLRSDFHFK